MPGIQPEELREATVYATTHWKTLGPRLELNRTREVYYLGLLNQSMPPGGTRVAIAEQASAGLTRMKDQWGLALNDDVVWPDELSQYSVPIYTMKTDTASVKYMRVSAVASSVWCRILFRDIP